MKMNPILVLLTMSVCLVTCPISASSTNHANTSHSSSSTFRQSNFSNEFGLYHPEAINARGYAVVKSGHTGHRVTIQVNGLEPAAQYAVLNHWFDPIAQRGIGSTLGLDDDPSCNGHAQFVGPWPVAADRKGRLKVTAHLDQLAPHLWVVNLEKFMEVTNNLTERPSSAEAFIAGGLLIPYRDLSKQEASFQDMSPLVQGGC